MKRFTKIISTLLCIVIVVSTPMQALAATSKYISDLHISVADTPEKAKAELTEMGYTVFEGDLNAGAGKSPTLDNKKYVYLGYKTTSNSKEAITDVSVMNMNGSYSMGKYQKALSEKAEHIDALLRDFLKITKEFQANYQLKNKTALLAYQLLNQFKEDDSGMLLGDFLMPLSYNNYNFFDNLHIHLLIQKTLVSLVLQKHIYYLFLLILLVMLYSLFLHIN